MASFLLRIILLGAPELLAEEAYYWNYATHLALGYLDHPPLSAWLIALCTSVFGVSEFGVRFGAFLCSLVTGFFVYRTTLLLGTRRSAWLTVSVLSVIPYSMGNFFFISPDAPLVAAWAASIYFMLRIIRLEPRDSGWLEWLGLGGAFGLELLQNTPSHYWR